MIDFINQEDMILPGMMMYLSFWITILMPKDSHLLVLGILP